MSDDPLASKQVIQQFYEAVGGGDIAAIAACLHDDFELHEPPAMPYGGVYRGLDGMQSALRRLAEVLDFSQLEIGGLIGDGDEVVVTLQVGVQRSNALVHNAEHWTVRDGKVWRGRIFTFDPSPVLEQAAAG